jgi:CelD/BcsL family acetyltransferase involved in cellulose biosynthesis
MRVEIHRGTVEDLLPDWEELFEEDVEATPYSSSGWSRAWWRIWGDSAELWLALAHDGSGLRGLAPLAITRHGGLRVLRPVSGDIGDYWDVLAAPEERAGTSAAIAREIATRRQEWDAVVLHGLPAGSEIGGALEAAGLRVRRPRAATCPVIELPATFDAYLGSLPAQRRSNLRRHLRRLDEGELELREVERPEDLERAIGRWHELRERQWQAAGRNLYGLQRSTAFRAFMLEAARLMAPAGLLTVWELRHEGEVAGVYVNLVDRRAFYWYLGGFDPSLSQLGIGKIAIAQGIRASIDAGRRTFDFGAGGEPYKYWYGATDRRTAVFLAGSSLLRSRVGLLAASAARQLRERRADPAGG